MPDGPEVLVMFLQYVNVAFKHFGCIFTGFIFIGLLASSLFELTASPFLFPTAQYRLPHGQVAS